MRPIILILLLALPAIDRSAHTLTDAQPATSFEVASIRERMTAGEGGYVESPDRFIRINSSLRDLLEYAYEVQRFQIVGGPDWITSTRYDVNAKARYVPTTEQMRVMVQRLLADRFRLKVSTAKREMPLYVLRMARDDGQLGRLMTRTTVDCAAVESERRRTGQSTQTAPSAQPNGGLLCTTRLAGRPGPNGVTLRYQTSGTTTTELARWLSPYVGSVVVDRTGLTGSFDLELSFAPSSGPAVSASVDDAGTVFTALQEQLGLKLESSSGPVDVIVIDSAERPTPD